MIIDFYNRNGGSPSPTGDATELQPKTAIPSSGAAGTVIATNIAEHQEWQTLEDFTTSGWTAVRGLCNEDTWLNVRFLGYENRYNGSFNGSEWINGGPENWYSGWSVEWDGNNWTATNNDWLSVSGTTDGNTWQIDFSIAAGGVNDGWDIPSNTEVLLTIPQTVGIYQANSAGTYAEIGKYAESAETADYAREATCSSWGFFIRNSNGQPWQDMHHNYEQRQNDMYFDGHMLKINNGSENIPYVFSEENIPESVKNANHIKGTDAIPPANLQVSGNVLANKEGGIYQLSSATTSGWVSVYPTYVEQDIDNTLKVRYSKDYATHMDVDITYNNAGAVMRLQGIDGFDVNEWAFEWTIVSAGTNYYQMEKDFDGVTVSFEAEIDGDWMVITFNVAVAVGFTAWTDANLQQEYQFYVTDRLQEVNAVMSEQGIGKIWKGTQQEYDAITTKDSSTIYIII